MNHTPPQLVLNVLLSGLLLLNAAATAHAAPAPVATVIETRSEARTSHRIILKPTGTPDAVVDRLRRQFGEQVATIRPMSGGAWVIAVGTAEKTTLDLVLADLQDDQLIEYAQTDAATRVMTNPDDRLFRAQWQHHSLEEQLASMDLVNTWDITTGSSDIVVAVIDTGFRFEHADLTNRLLDGYDFVSGINESLDTFLPVPDEYNFIRSNDGDGRDPDPTDPGDGVDEMLSAEMSELGIHCPVTSSTWHGTAMTSLLAANANDNFGMAGVDWQARILPVRAIGRCGGSRSDLLDAIRWAAGVDDPSLPPNPNPARIINLSLGIDDICGAADQRAIDDARAAGALVVAAVGNQARDLDSRGASPSDCHGVIGVTAINASGELARYSNFGADVDIAAPGGEGRQGDDLPILVATNDGEISPATGSAHKYTTGTSVASPMVAGVLSLMLSVNPELSNDELEALLYTAARRFPNHRKGRDCRSTICGAGMLDAFAATTLAERSLSTPVPELAAAKLAESGGSAGFGCSISPTRTPDPVWPLLLVGLFVVTRRRRVSQVADA
ncbi:MAG: S8 family peptidase [Gammaproteobacteria bacterium]|nr:S8 family peptidase [Gammaproteobacteria bacterium]